MPTSGPRDRSRSPVRDDVDSPAKRSRGGGRGRDSDGGGDPEVSSTTGAATTSDGVNSGAIGLGGGTSVQQLVNLPYNPGSKVVVATIPFYFKKTLSSGKLYAFPAQHSLSSYFTSKVKTYYKSLLGTSGFTKFDLSPIKVQIMNSSLVNLNTSAGDKLHSLTQKSRLALFHLDPKIKTGLFQLAKRTAPTTKYAIKADAVTGTASTLIDPQLITECTDATGAAVDFDPLDCIFGVTRNCETFDRSALDFAAPFNPAAQSASYAATALQNSGFQWKPSYGNSNGFDDAAILTNASKYDARYRKFVSDDIIKMPHYYYLDDDSFDVPPVHVTANYLTGKADIMQTLSEKSKTASSVKTQSFILGEHAYCNEASLIHELDAGAFTARRHLGLPHRKESKMFAYIRPIPKDGGSNYVQEMEVVCTAYMTVIKNGNYDDWDQQSQPMGDKQCYYSPPMKPLLMNAAASSAVSLCMF